MTYSALVSESHLPVDPVSSAMVFDPPFPAYDPTDKTRFAVTFLIQWHC
jgi:hypothetical protein